MATIKISELPAIQTVAGNDFLPIVDASETETKKITKSQLLSDIDASELDLSNMPEATQINDNDYLIINQGGTNKKISKSNSQFASGEEVAISTTTPVDPENEIKLWVDLGNDPTPVTASASQYGVVKIGTGVQVSNGVISVPSSTGIYDLLFDDTCYYDTSVSYQVGDYTIYNSLLYKCISNTTGPFDSSKWTQDYMFEGE